MISDEEKQQAWGWIHMLLLNGPLDDKLSREQLDYLLTESLRKSIPGDAGEVRRTELRRLGLALAVCISKAKTPKKSFEAIYKELAKHYGISASLVKQSYLETGKLEGVTEYAMRAAEFYQTDLSFSQESLAIAELPHINFENFPDK